MALKQVPFTSPLPTPSMIQGQSVRSQQVLPGQTCTAIKFQSLDLGQREMESLLWAACSEELDFHIKLGQTLLLEDVQRLVFDPPDAKTKHDVCTSLLRRAMKLAIRKMTVLQRLHRKEEGSKDIQNPSISQ